jgi:hypothetical protein
MWSPARISGSRAADEFDKLLQASPDDGNRYQNEEAEKRPEKFVRQLGG